MIDATPPYTCPAGKKAKVTLQYMLVALGASANVYIRVNSINLGHMAASDVNLQHLLTFQLNAGEEFHGHGDVSDNATINYSYSILELPA
jgi:hypothetical protein